MSYGQWTVTFSGLMAPWGTPGENRKMMPFKENNGLLLHIKQCYSFCSRIRYGYSQVFLNLRFSRFVCPGAAITPRVWKQDSTNTVWQFLSCMPNLWHVFLFRISVLNAIYFHILIVHGWTQEWLLWMSLRSSHLTEWKENSNFSLYLQHGLL